VKVAFVIALLASRAYAGTCDVAIVRAPDDVRAIVEIWLNGEICAVPLEVRILRVEQGLYVMALDGRQRIRERVVPDAQTAGVLIASWAADDKLLDERLSVVDLSWTPPSVSPGTVVPMQVDAPPRPPSPSSLRAGNTFALLATVMTESSDEIGGLGLRGELDLRARGHWRYGIAASLAQSTFRTWGPDDAGEFNTVDLEALGYIAHVRSSPSWQLRGAIGAGLIGTYADGVFYNEVGYAMGYPKALGVFPVADASLTLGCALTRNWALATGPLVTWFGQELSNPNETQPDIPARGLQLMWSVGGRWGL